MFKAFDAAPASINCLRDVHGPADEDGRRAGEPDLGRSPSSSCKEVQKYCSLTNHMWDGFWFLANRRAWERLPENIRAIASKHLNAAAVSQRADVARSTATCSRNRRQGNGVQRAEDRHVP